MTVLVGGRTRNIARSDQCRPCKAGSLVYGHAVPDAVVFGETISVSRSPNELDFARAHGFGEGGGPRSRFLPGRRAKRFKILEPSAASFALLSWSSRRQKVVSRSSTEAEFVSLSGALFNDAVPMLEVWEALIPEIHLHIQEDNQACIAIIRKGFSAKLRHLAKTRRVNVASTCELVNTSDNIDLAYVETGSQRGDPLTKALAVQKWSHALELLSIATSSQPSYD